MPRYAAPNHKDCWIDCPAGGYAIFVPPHGPCEKGCDDPGASLARILTGNIDLRFAFRIQISGRPKFLKLCNAILALGLKDEDRRLLGRAIDRVMKPERTLNGLPVSPRSSRSIRLFSEHAETTISTLISDIYRATQRRGPRGGGSSNGGFQGRGDWQVGSGVTAISPSPDSPRQSGVMFR